MFVNAKCSHCGIPVAYEDSREFIYCWSCGQKIFKSELNLENAQPSPPVSTTPAQSQPEVENHVRAEGQNLIVTYQTTHPEYPLFFRIHTTNEKFYISPGQTMQFHLPMGLHSLYFGFKDKFYRRRIRINNTGTITVNCIWNTERRIDVIMPSALCDQ